MIIGIFVAIRRPKLHRLTLQDYPEVDPTKFAEWHSAEIISTDTFLWASWGSCLIGNVIIGIVSDIELTLAATIAFRVFLFVGTVLWFILAGLKSSKARKLREEAGIQWPK